MAHLNSFELFERIRVLTQVQDIEPLSDVKMRPRRQRHLAARQGAQRREPEAPRDTCGEQTKTHIYFTYVSDALINSDYVMCTEYIVNNELERVWKEGAVAKFKVLSRHDWVH
jgi:hypothetical protein